MKTKLLSLVILVAATILSCQKEQVNPLDNSNQTAGVTPNSNSSSTAPVTSTGNSGSTENAGTTSALEGKWQQTKIVSYLLDNTGKKMDDTTYLSPFTKDDYALFSANGTCATSISHYFYWNIPGNNTTPTPISPIVSDFNVKAAGSNFVLTSQGTAIGPGGGWTTDTLSMRNTDTLVIHSVFSGFGPSTHLFISDCYYARTNNSDK